MDKLISITYETKYGDICTNDAIVEYITIVDDGLVQYEILNIFLPEGISTDQHEAYKEQAANNFYAE